MLAFNGGSLSFTAESTNNPVVIEGSELDLVGAYGRFSITGKVVSGGGVGVTCHFANLPDFSDEDSGELGLTASMGTIGAATSQGDVPMAFRYMRLKAVSAEPDQPGEIVVTIFIRPQL